MEDEEFELIDGDGYYEGDEVGYSNEELEAAVAQQLEQLEVGAWGGGGMKAMIARAVRSRSPSRRAPSRRAPARRVVVRRAAPRVISRRSPQRLPSYINRSPSAGKKAEFPLGLSTVTFNAGSGTVLTMLAKPQRVAKPSRLTIDFAGDAPGLLTVLDIKVGTLSQLVSNDPLPVAMFRPDAVGNTLEIAELGPGIELEITIGISTPPLLAETVTVSAAMICDVLD